MQKQTTTNEKGPAASCRDCEGLRLGTSSSQKPHEYLVRSAYSEATGSSVYTCLLCRSSLTQDTDSGVTRWK